MTIPAGKGVVRATDPRDERLRRTEWGYRVAAALGALAAVLLAVAGFANGEPGFFIATVCFGCFWWAMVTSANQAEAKREALGPDDR